jgi:hypothetical protein
MRNAFAVTLAAALAAVALPPQPARAHDRLIAVIPPEIGITPPGPAGLAPFRCSDGPAHNFYHDALYSQPPALNGGYAYRPHYRYSAYRVVPRTYVCAERWP